MSSTLPKHNGQYIQFDGAGQHFLLFDHSAISVSFTAKPVNTVYVLKYGNGFKSEKRMNDKLNMRSKDISEWYVCIRCPL